MFKHWYIKKYVQNCCVWIGTELPWVISEQHHVTLIICVCYMPPAAAIHQTSSEIKHLVKLDDELIIPVKACKINWSSKGSSILEYLKENPDICLKISFSISKQSINRYEEKQSTQSLGNGFISNSLKLLTVTHLAVILNYLCAAPDHDRATVLALFVWKVTRNTLRWLWSLDRFRNAWLRCWRNGTRTLQLTGTGNLWWRELRWTIN